MCGSHRALGGTASGWWALQNIYFDEVNLPGNRSRHVFLYKPDLKYACCPLSFFDSRRLCIDRLVIIQLAALALIVPPMLPYMHVHVHVHVHVRVRVRVHVPDVICFAFHGHFLSVSAWSVVLIGSVLWVFAGYGSKSWGVKTLPEIDYMDTWTFNLCASSVFCAAPVVVSVCLVMLLLLLLLWACHRLLSSYHSFMRSCIWL
jgi:hypothetical protein